MRKTSSEKKKLTEKETLQLINLLKKIRLPAPYPIFVALAKSLTLVTVDVALMPDNKRILLTHRTDAWYDHWHIPGGILLSGEDPKDAAVRVACAELNLAPKGFEFVHYFFERTVRGDEVVLLFRAVSDRKPPEGKYFSLRKMPAGFLEEQREEINYLKKHYT